MLWLFSLGVGLLGVGIIVGSYFGWKYPFGREACNFSYFPNRNQTSSLLCLGGIIAFGLSIEALRRCRVMTMVGLVVVVVIFFALIFSISRAGIFLFFSGCIIWLLCSLNPSRFTRNFVLATSGLILIFSIFVFFGGKTLKRVSDFVTHEAGWKSNFRLRIYKDATQLILDQPVTGVGLGNFSVVFPQYRDASASSSHIIHPESDWFWLGAELGLPGVCLAAIGLVGICRGCWTMESRRERRYRILIFAALFVFVIHSFVDVPGHRLGTFMAASFLYGLTGLKESRERPLWMAPLAWRIVGLILVAIGMVWATAHLTGRPWHSQTTFAVSESSLQHHSEGEDAEEVREALEKAVQWTPMKWQAYFNRAQFRLNGLRNPRLAIEDFRRSRFLEPTFAEVPFLEGLAWSPISTVYALSAWQEALRRKTADRAELFRRILNHTSRLPRFSEGVRALSKIDSDTQYLYLARLKREEYRSAIASIVQRDPFLSEFSRKQQESLFTKWIQSGGAEELLAHLNSHPPLETAHWQILAHGQAAINDFEKASDTAVRYCQQTQFPEYESREDYSQLVRSYRLNPENIVAGLSLLRREIESENWARANRIAETLTLLPEPPDLAYYWKARILCQVGEFEESWEAWKGYFGVMEEADVEN